MLWSTFEGANHLAGDSPTAQLFLAHYHICGDSWCGQNSFLQRKPAARAGDNSEEE